jgi:predicted nucleic acid-binding Zn ribbon protein
MRVMMSEKPDEPGIILTEEQLRRRRARSLALALVLGVLVVLIWVVTLVKGPLVLNKPF